MSELRNCPITMEEIKDPFTLSCAHVFEREAIRNWLKNNNTCPICRTPQETENNIERIQNNNICRTPQETENNIERIQNNNIERIQNSVGRRQNRNIMQIIGDMSSRGNDNNNFYEIHNFFHNVNNIAKEQNLLSNSYIDSIINNINTNSTFYKIYNGFAFNPNDCMICEYHEDKKDLILSKLKKIYRAISFMDIDPRQNFTYLLKLKFLNTIKSYKKNIMDFDI